jgi:hypothetical protein
MVPEDGLEPSLLSKSDFESLVRRLRAININTTQPIFSRSCDKYRLRSLDIVRLYRAKNMHIEL